MKTSRPKKSIVFAAGLILLAFASTTMGLAQSTPAPQLSVIVTEVKPDMQNDWLDLQKNEVNPALKKAGIASRAVTGTLLGNTYEYVSISPLPKLAEFDERNPIIRALGPEAGTRLLAKLRKCTDSQHMYIINPVTELSIPADRNAPPLVHVTTTFRVLPGKGQDYENYIKTDLLPVYKKAKAEGKIAGYSFNRRGLGSNPLYRTQTIYMNKFADMDGGPPMDSMLGPEAAAKLRAKSAGMGTVTEQVVRRRIAELSF